MTDNRNSEVGANARGDDLRSQTEIERSAYTAQQRSFSKSEVNIDLRPEDRQQDNIQVEGIKFITEKEFKKDKECKICNNEFGNFQTRQHHCRLCANSVCDYCSTKRVNDERVCDLCFMKIKNRSGEKRKKQLMATIKSYMQTLGNNVKQGKKDMASLDEKLKEKEREYQQVLRAVQENREKLSAQLTQVQDEKTRKQDLIDEFEQSYQPKQMKVKDLTQELERLENQTKIADTEVAFKMQSMENKQRDFDLLRKNKVTIEQSEDIKKLPNYEHAIKYSTDHISEAIISLDKQMPPEKYYQDLMEKKRQSSSGATPGGGSGSGVGQQTPQGGAAGAGKTQYKVSYQEDVMRNTLMRERSDSAQSFRTHNVRPKGDKFMCYM